VSLRLVEVPAQVHEPFYGVIANPLLWFVQHRLYGLALEPSLGRAEHAAWEQGYVAANQLVADAVAEQVDRAGGQATVLLHDYHFYLVGDLLRQRYPRLLHRRRSGCRRRCSPQRCWATGQARFLHVPEVAGRARCSVLGRGAGWQVP